jgi:conjugal transfer ATP-binding protein TraC
VLIKGPEMLAMGRLVLDPYSATLYSSSPQVFAAIDAKTAAGMSMAEAIEEVAFPGSVQEQRGVRADYAEAAE